MTSRSGCCRCRLPQGVVERSGAGNAADAHLRHAARLAEVDLDLAPDAADALATAEILRPGEPLAFVHPLLHSSIYADLWEAERGRAHREAARSLAEEGTSVERVAAHLLLAERGGRGWVVDACAPPPSAPWSGEAPTRPRIT